MKKKVVLVQDNKDILEIMDSVLEQEGFDVISALDTKPIDEIEEIDPDLVIIDDHIKGKQKGSDVVKKLKSQPETEGLAAILTSTSNKLPELAAACNADDFIEKPFDIDYMVDVVKRNT